MKLRYVLFLALGLLQGISAVEAAKVLGEDIGALEEGSFAKGFYAQLEVIERGFKGGEFDAKKQAANVLPQIQGTLDMVAVGTRPATQQETKLFSAFINMLATWCNLSHSAGGNVIAKAIKFQETNNHKVMKGLLAEHSYCYAKIIGVDVILLEEEAVQIKLSSCKIMPSRSISFG